MKQNNIMNNNNNNNKCATASVVRGKLIESSNVDLPNYVTIQALYILDSYKYLGVLNNAVKDSKVKSLVITNYKKVRKILKSALNGRNIIIAINTLAIPLVRYTGGIIKWTQAEVRSLDVSTRKLLTMYLWVIIWHLTLSLGFRKFLLLTNLALKKRLLIVNTVVPRRTLRIGKKSDYMDNFFATLWILLICVFNGNGKQSLKGN